MSDVSWERMHGCALVNNKTVRGIIFVIRKVRAMREKCGSVSERNRAVAISGNPVPVHLWATSGVGDKAGRGAESGKGTHTEGNPTRAAQVPISRRAQRWRRGAGTWWAEVPFSLGLGSRPRPHLGFFAFCQLLRPTTPRTTPTHPHFLARMTNLEADNLHETFCAKDGQHQMRVKRNGSPIPFPTAPVPKHTSSIPTWHSN